MTQMDTDGCPQADGGGEQQLSPIGQQLKENIFYCRYIAGNCCSRKRDGGLWSGMSSNIQEFIRIFFNCCYIAGNCCSRKRDGGLWSAIAINDQQLKEKKCISTDDTDGGPQADDGKECESSEFKRNLNGCPQADSLGERQLENNKYPQMTQMDTDGCPQADEVGEQQLSSIGQQLKEKYVCVPWMICEPNEKEGKKLGHPTFRVMRQSCRAYSLRVKYRPNLIAN